MLLNVTEAYLWLLNHPIFIDVHGLQRFHECLFWEYVLVCPETNSIDDDPSKNTTPRCWVEIGPWHYDELGARWAGTHDPELDCGGNSFEEALTTLVGLVRDKYGDYTQK